MLLNIHVKYNLYLVSGKKQVPFSVAIGNVQLMHECISKHLRMGTASKNETAGPKKMKSLWPNYSSGLPSSGGRYSPKQWMNCLTNLTYTYNPSTTPDGK